jgi:PTS system galactitol-specific IIC component
MQTAIDLLRYAQERLDVSAITIALIAILGLRFGLPAGKAVRGAFAAGAGLAGLFLMVGALESVLVPAVRAMAENGGLSADVLDIGEAPFAAVVSASRIGAWILPLGIAVNLLMLATNTTRTFKLDLTGYRYFAYTGILVQSAADSYPLGLAAAALNMAVVLIIADRTAPALEQYADLRGISLPHGFTAAFVPVAFVVNRIVDYLPGLNRPKADMDCIRKRLGVFGEPALLGFALGFAVALLANLGAVPVSDLAADSLSAAVRTAAVFALAPKILAFLTDGLRPFFEAAQSFAQRRRKNRSPVRIGLDPVCGFGSPLVLTCAPILLSLSVFLAAVLPGERMLPFAGLALVPYILVAVLPVTKGAFFRTLLVGAVTTAVMLYCGSGLSDLFMRAVAETGAEAYASGTDGFSSVQGANPLTWVMAALGGMKHTGLAIMAVLTLGLALQNRGLIVKEAKRAAGKRASAAAKPPGEGDS